MNTLPHPRNRALPIVIGAFICLACTVVLGIIWNRLTTPLRPVTTDTPVPDDSTPLAVTSTPRITDTAEPTQPPTDTPIPPTAVPFPIRVDFNDPIQPFWVTGGSPIFASAESRGYGFDGVFTAPAETPASLFVGNSAWTDYVVSYRANGVPGGQIRHEVSVRMKDMNNRVVLFCGW